MQFGYTRQARTRWFFTAKVLLAACWCVAALQPTPAAAALAREPTAGQPVTGSAVRTFVFSIPAGPLREALRRYGDVTGMAVLVDDGLVAGRSASAVQGSKDAQQALRQLLDGSGLMPRYSGADAFTLELGQAPSPLPSAAQPLDLLTADVRMARLQQAVETALCASPAARPGDYRAALQLWFDPRGGVEKMRLLATTGSDTRDRAITAALGQMSQGDVDMHDVSPVTLLVSPRQPGSHVPCAQGRPR